MKTLSNSSIKPYQLKQHLITVYTEHSKRDRAFFEVKETGLKRVKLDSSGAFHKQAKSIVHASYAVALLEAKKQEASYNRGDSHKALYSWMCSNCPQQRCL